MEIVSTPVCPVLEDACNHSGILADKIMERFDLRKTEKKGRKRDLLHFMHKSVEYYSTIFINYRVIVCFFTSESSFLWGKYYMGNTKNEKAMNFHSQAPILTKPKQFLSHYCKTALKTPCGRSLPSHLTRNPFVTLDFFLLINVEVMQLYLNCFLEATIQSMWLRNRNKHSIMFSYIASNSRGDKL